MNGIHEVRGSIPLVSTNTPKKRAPTRCPFLFGVPKVLKTIAPGRVDFSQFIADCGRLGQLAQLFSRRFRDSSLGEIRLSCEEGAPAAPIDLQFPQSVR